MLMMTPELRRQLRSGLAISGKLRSTVVTLAKTQKVEKRKLNRERHDRLLTDIITIMKTRAFSKFEFEGVCRSGLRSGLCLEGWRWHEADACAAEIVSTALNRIGAVRPMWKEGQPEYICDDVIERTRCVRCGQTIPEERHAGRSGVKFCSIECNRATVAEKQRLSGEHLTMLEWLAACSVKSQRTVQDRSRRCACCDGVFIARDPDGKYCSRACDHVGRTKTDAPRPCEHCGSIWEPQTPGQRRNRFCSRSCATSSRVHI